MDDRTDQTAPTEPAAREQLSPHEIRHVLDRYAIGTPTSIRPFQRGNPAAPKALVETERGRFLLKRRAPGLDDPARIALEHEAELTLQRAGAPVAPLARSRDGDTLTGFEGRLYELFGFVDGGSWEPSEEAARRAGRALGRIHAVLRPMPAENPDGLARQERVQKAFDILGSGLPEIRGMLERLGHDWTLARGRRQALGVPAWPSHLIHGDFHPGNTLWRGGELVGVVDFELIRGAPAVEEAAIAALHFALDRRSDDPRAWSDAPDVPRLEAFWAGYRAAAPDVEPDAARAAPWLMVDGLIAEALPRACRPGGFGALRGADVLPYIARATAWLADHADGVGLILSRAEH